VRSILLKVYRLLVAGCLRMGLALLRAGRTRPFLAVVADDIHFRFPGEHSWAADFHSKGEVARWLRRYVAVGLKLYPRKVLVSGPPWRTTVCTWFVDSLVDEDGRTVYRNEGVLVDRLVWGRVVEHVSFEDTQKTAALDRYLGAE
jgi:hypothetical protein